MVEVRELIGHMYDVVGALHAVHAELGVGLNEYCYQEGFAIELGQREIPFEREKSFHPVYRGIPMKAEFRLDFLCKGDIIVECKAVPALLPPMRAQLFNYMRILRMPCGILVNFYPFSLHVERYFFDPETQQMLTASGAPFRQ